ncbi:Rz1-like lysis system protein LysC [Celerinatantimonas sp. MCCC 1A17872]|uniref:Rz1-like lysis system protein LysC n=1 Tax=Celerinatantimonas sp. MCCC 1A17872 TaxID=3177514 RepID=UPI0038C9EFC2
MTARLTNGLASLCLLALCSCSSEQPICPAPVVVVHHAPSISACSKSSVTITTNGELLQAYLTSQGELSQCAAKVDAVIQSQQETNAKTH